MKRLDGIIDYFCEYEMYDKLMSKSIKDINYKSININEFCFSDAKQYVYNKKIEKILFVINKLLLSSKKPEAKAYIQSYLDTEIDLEYLFDQLPLKNKKFLGKPKSQVKEIADENHFYICYPILKYKDTFSPLVTIKCLLCDDHFTVEKFFANINLVSLILAWRYECDLSDARNIYGEEILRIINAINALVDENDFVKITELIDNEFRNVLGDNFKLSNFKSYNEWQLFAHAGITFDTLDEILDSCFRDELLTLKRLYKDYGDLPAPLSKYIFGNESCNELGNVSTENCYHFGSYTKEYSINEKQWRIMTCLDDADLICVEGPPGTGKTTLLKEIIADEFVKKAVHLYKVWDKEWQENGSGNKSHYISPLGGDNYCSIVVTSTNNKAVDNIGIELLSEIPFFESFMQQLNVEEQNQFKGIFCARLGKSDNINAFYDEIMDPFCSFLEEKEVTEEEENQAKENFINLILSLDEINKKVTDYLSVRKESENLCETECETADGLLNKYDNQISHLLSSKNSLDEASIKVSDNLNKLIFDQGNHNSKKVELQNKIDQVEEKIKNLYKDLSDYQNLGIKKKLKFLFSRAKWLTREYPSERYIEDIISEKKKEIEKLKTQLTKSGDLLQEIQNQINSAEQDKQKIKYEINDAEQYINLYSNKKVMLSRYVNLRNELKELNIDYDGSEHDLRNCKKIFTLRNTIFNAAVSLFEVYIIKSKNEIIYNLKKLMVKYDTFINFLPNFYSNDQAHKENDQIGIRSIWETFFLCFPVVTTTLHSFRKSTYQFMPQLYDLLLVDESGQVVPYYTVAPLYRVRRAVFVGDENQIEPIKSVPPDLLDSKYTKIMDEADYHNVKVDYKSVQSFANRASGIYEIVNDRKTGIILNEHRRCEKSIMAFSNDHIYNRVLKLLNEDHNEKLFGNNLVAFDIRGIKLKSHINEAEIEACKNIVSLLREKNNADDSQIGIITPFKNQSKKINEAFDGKIAVGTVHTFQGGEKEYIIFSNVVDNLDSASKGLTGFIGGKGNLLNVAFSRAKKQFIFIGNFNAAQNSNNFLKKALDEIKQHGVLYSLFETEHNDYNNEHWKDAFSVLKGAEMGSSDEIGVYLKDKIPHGIIGNSKVHNEILNELFKLMKEEVHVFSPWISRYVVTDEFLSNIEKKIENNVSVNIQFGYKKSNYTIEDIDRIIELDVSWNKDQTKEAIIKLQKLLGGNLKYNPPLHTKLFLVDRKYMFIGSLNWLMNSGKTNTQELSCLITDKNMINYVEDAIIGM